MNGVTYVAPERGLSGIPALDLSIIVGKPNIK